MGVEQELAVFGDLCAAGPSGLEIGAVARWDPDRHPRDAEGQFARVDLSSGSHHADGVSIVTSRNGQVVTLHLIRSNPQVSGRGRARAVLQQLVDQADQEGFIVALTPEPLAGDQKTKKSRLVAWYKSMGFVKKPRSEFEINSAMVRYPRGVRR